MSKLLITFIYCYYYYYDCYFVLCWSPNSDDHRYAPPIIDADKRTTAFLQNFVIGYQTVPPPPHKLLIDRYKIPPKSSYHQAVGKPAKMEKYKYAKTRYKYATTIVKPYSKKPFHFGGYSLAKPPSNNNNHSDSAAIPWSIKPLPPPLSTTTAPTSYSDIINDVPPWTLQALPPPVATRTPRTMDSTMINNLLLPPNDWVLSPLPPPLQSTSPMLRRRPQNIHQLVVPVKVNQYYFVDGGGKNKKQFPKQKLNSRPSKDHHRMIIHIEAYNSPRSSLRSSSDADNLLLAHSSTRLPEYSIDSRYERRKRSVIIESVKIPNSKKQQLPLWERKANQPTDGTDHDQGSKYNNRLFKLFPVNNRHHRFGVLSPLRERENFNIFNGYANDLSSSSSSNITDGGKFAKNYPKQNYSTTGPVRFERQPAVSIQNIIRGNNSGSHYNNNDTTNKSNFPSPTAIINTLIAGGNSPRLMKMNILTLNNLATDYDDWSPNRTAAATYLLANPRRAINFNTTTTKIVDGGYWKNLAQYEKFGMRLNRTLTTIPVVIKNETTINVGDDAVVMTGESVAKNVYQRVNVDNSADDKYRVNQNQSSISDNRPPSMKQTILGGYNYATPYFVSNMIQSFSPADHEQSISSTTLLTSTISTDTISSSSTGLASTVNDIEQFSLPPGLEPYLQSSEAIPDYYYRYDKKIIKNAEKQDREMPAQWSSSTSSLVSPFVIEPEDYYDNFEQPPVSAAAIPTATIRLPLTTDDITWFDDRNRSVENNNNNFVLITQRPAQSYNSLLPISSNLTGTFDVVGQGYSSSVLQQGDTTTTGADYTNFVHLLDGGNNNYERTTASSSIGNPTYFYDNFHQSPYDHSGFIDFSAATPLPNPTTSSSTAATIRDDNLFPPAAKYVDFTGNLADFLDGTADGVDVRNSHLDELNLEFFQPIIIDVDKQIEREQQQRLFGVNGDKTESSYQRIKPLSSSPPEFHQTSPLSAPQKLRIKVNDLLSSSSSGSSSSTTTTTVRYTEPVRMPDNLHESTMDIVLHKKSLRHPPVFDLEPQSSEIKSTSSQLVDLPSN